MHKLGKNAGKGSSPPRNIFSKDFRDNYSLINWSSDKTLDKNNKSDYTEVVNEKTESTENKQTDLHSKTIPPT